MGQDIFWQSAATCLSEGKHERSKLMLLWQQDAWRVIINYLCHCTGLRFFLYALANRVSLQCSLYPVTWVMASSYGKNIHLTLFISSHMIHESKINQTERNKKCSLNVLNKVLLDFLIMSSMVAKEPAPKAPLIHNYIHHVLLKWR